MLEKCQTGKVLKSASFMSQQVKVIHKYQTTKQTITTLDPDLSQPQTKHLMLPFFSKFMLTMNFLAKESVFWCTFIS